MTYIECDNSGYICLDEGRHILFSDDGSHSFLFDYVQADLSDIGHLFEQHISAQMDINTFELKKTRTNFFLEEIKDRLKCIHPYYEHEYQKVMIREIGSYFNSLLMHSLYVSKNTALKPNLSEEWYTEKIRALMPCPQEIADHHAKSNGDYSNWTDGNYPEGLYPSDFYNLFIKWSRISKEAAEYFNEIDFYNLFIKWSRISKEAAEYFNEIFITYLPQNPPIGFYNEAKTQTNVCNMLYFGLDIMVQSLKELNPYRRLYLYSAIFGEGLAIKKRSSLHPPLVFHKGYDNTKTIKEIETFSPIESLKALNIAHIDSIPTYMLDDFNKAVEYVSSLPDISIHEEYEIDDLHQLLYLEILSMVKTNKNIQKCKNCGRYFIVTDKRHSYCDRISADGKTCKDIGNTDPAQKIYRKAYKTHHARIKNGTMTEDDFDIWQKEAKDKLAEVHEGKLTVIAFEKWIKNS